MTTLDLDALERAAIDRALWLKCRTCFGHGVVTDRGATGTDFLGPKTCPECTDGLVAFVPRQFFLSLISDYRTLQERVEGAEGANERDRTSIMRHCNSVADAITRRRWLMTSRGSYEWDDERYRQEFAAALEEIEAAIEPLRKIGSDLTNCPRTQAEVVAARAKAGEPHEQE